MDCLFCKIINGDIPCYKIYEDDIVLAFLDINPLSNGHTLIVPKEHTLDIETIDKDTIDHIFSIIPNIKNILNDKLKFDGYTLAQNNGIAEEVKHFHLHFIPKYKEENEILKAEDVYNIIKDY